MTLGKTCSSPSRSWLLVSHWVACFLLFDLVVQTWHEGEHRVRFCWKQDIIRKFVPSAVFKQIEDGTLTYVNEMSPLLERKAATGINTLRAHEACA